MQISKENIEIATKVFLGELSLDEAKLYDNLMLSYMSDQNSSTIRERTTLHFLNYQVFETKHGPDGFCPQTGRHKEVKPIYVGDSKKKVGNSGNFNDMTLDLLEEKVNMDVICSLFYNFRFVYVVEFPFTDIYDRIKSTIVNKPLGKRVVCSFGYKDYDTDNISIHYYNEKLAEECLSKPHVQMIEKHLRRLGKLKEYQLNLW
jgi:hypothetical protein